MTLSKANTWAVRRKQAVLPESKQRNSSTVLFCFGYFHMTTHEQY
jgi:hypothetical protein